MVDDSPSALELLVYLLNGDPELQVIGTASNGEEAVKAARRLKPDVITMDIHMPLVDGFAATRSIMEECPTRIVMVTASVVPREVSATFKALEAGALTVIGRPLGLGHPDFDTSMRELLQTIKLLSEVSVVRRWSHARNHPPLESALASGRQIRLVAIGASTGGPLVLRDVLSQLPATFTLPIVIVQHIAAGFAAGFAEWLGQSSGFPVRLAEHGAPILGRCAYLAPDGVHMEVTAGGQVRLTSGPAEHGLRPSVACLFRSVAQAYGGNAVGVLLTGMGKDGAQELKLMRNAGAVTIAQDEESCVVFGMPGEAVKLEAAHFVLAPDDIAATLRRLGTQP
ncbi:Chemotaxis response regulator protein-glutamate methylesterase of group 1 operon [Andreprevotia sp. IGB-42]|nr:Chemotaxis response regulator protein-glutamate methylesterase of group 1 operon [Andreprevotia sp. IGB-42]